MAAKQGGSHADHEATRPRSISARAEGTPDCGSLVAWLRRGVAA
jgi:hypothetical protein